MKPQILSKENLASDTSATTPPRVSPSSHPLRRAGDNLELQRAAAILRADGWHATLEHFAQATNIVLSLYDWNGTRHAGVFAPLPLAQRMIEAQAWADDGACRAVEKELAIQAARLNTVQQQTAFDALVVFAIPVRLREQAIGAIVGGWLFDNFPDPVIADRLSKKLHLAFAEVWHLARQQVPINPEKLTIYLDLLQTFADATVNQQSEIARERAHSRELLTLNESAHALAAATSFEDIGQVAVRSAVALSNAHGARMLVADADATWRTVAALNFDDDDTGKHDFSQLRVSPRDDNQDTEPQSKTHPAASTVKPPSELHKASPNTAPERRSMTHRWRIPVEATGGELLGVIELNDARTYVVDETAYPQLQALAAQIAVALQKSQLLQDLKRERERLEIANHTKDEFLAVLSHELRTPLTPILGWVSMLHDEALRANPKMLKDALGAIERNARQELHLVDEMLDLSRILNHKILLEPKLICPSDALAAAFASAQSLLANRRLQLRLDTAENLPLINADPKRLQQVLANLIANAVKFTPDGGNITLGVRCESNCNDDAGRTHIVFYVQDDGIGLPPDLLGNIFERFRQADSSITRNYGGLGIGLSIVRGLIELHGGTVWAESEGDNQGATFYVRLPTATDNPIDKTLADEIVPRFDDRARASRREVTRGVRVLVLDDVADTREVLQSLLEVDGYTVTTAASVQEALAVSETFKPHVVLSDIGMLHQDGYRFLKNFRSRAAFAAVPVIALTGYTAPGDRVRTLAAGFTAHLSKPVEPHALHRALQTALQQGKTPAT